MKIDAHQHFWEYNPGKHSWIDDHMKVIKRDFLPEDLKIQLDLSGIAGTIAVQADQSESETQFLLDLSKQNEWIKGVVGWLDLRSKNVSDRLAHFTQQEKLVGLRHVVQDEPDPEFMLRADFQAGLSLLKEYNLTYDILIVPTQFNAAIATVKKYPEQKFVLDHIAKPYIKSGALGKWAKDIKRMADADNVMCKLSGMVTEADWTSWRYSDFIPYLDVVVDAFGTDRLMYGSDWPVCLLGGDYHEIIGLVSQYFSQFSPHEQAKIFGLNAQSFYGIK